MSMLMERRRHSAVSAPVFAYGVATAQPVGWWKADTLGLTVGAPVVVMPDYSPTGAPLSTGVAGTTFQTSNFAGGAARFTTTSSLTSLGFSKLKSVAAFTFFSVHKYADVVDGVVWTFGGNCQVGGFSNLYTVWASTTGSYAQVSLPLQTNKHVAEGVFNGTLVGNAARMIGNWDAASVAFSTYNGTEPAATDAVTGFTLGAGKAFDIAELLVYNVALSAGDRSTIRVALGAKWGVTVTP